MNIRFPLLAAGLCCLGFSCSTPVGMVQKRSFGKPSLACSLTDKSITESSGIAPSHRNAGVYFTHNDSGDTARFFKFNLQGKVLGTYSLEGAKAVDWEDIASAHLDGKDYLFLGDIGDNGGRRKNIVVYRVEEPMGNKARVDQTYTLTYPDKAHNAEALMVHPRTGDIYVVMKAAGVRSKVFYLPRPTASGSFTLKEIGSVKLGGDLELAQLITGGDIAPDARHVILRTYLAAYEFTAPEDFNKWPNTKPQKVALNLEFGGEGICYSTDGKTLLSTTEGNPCPVSQVPIEN